MHTTFEQIKPFFIFFVLQISTRERSLHFEDHLQGQNLEWPQRQTVAIGTIDCLLTFQVFIRVVFQDIRNLDTFNGQTTVKESQSSEAVCML